MVLPADQIGQPRVDRLMRQQVVQAEYQRPNDQRHRCHPQQRVAVLGEEGPRVIGRLSHIDQLAEKAEQRHLDQRREKAHHQHGRHQRPDLLQVVGIEAQHPGRRRNIRAGFEDVDQVFETAEQHEEVCFVAGWAGVFPEFDRSGAASGWTPRTRERFANHITGPSIRIGGQAQRCPPYATPHSSADTSAGEIRQSPFHALRSGYRWRTAPNGAQQHAQREPM